MKWVLEESKYVHLIPPKKQSSKKRRIFDQIAINVVNRVNFNPKNESEKEIEVENNSFENTQ